MALSVHENTANRLSGEIKALWRRVGEVGGMGEGGRGAWVGVGGQSGIKPSDEPSMEAWRVALEPRKVGPVEDDMERIKSEVLKEDLLNLKDEIGGLQEGVSSLTVTGPNQVLVLNNSKMRDIEDIMTKVSQIRSNFRMLKENGHRRYVYLEAEENGLVKDIQVLKDCLSEDQNYLEGVLNAEGICNTDGVRNVHPALDIKQTQVTSESKAIDNSEKMHQNVQSKIDNEMPQSLPLLKHSWDDRDHQVFVKIYQKYKTKQRRREEWMRTLMYKSEAEIEEHTAQYDDYLSEKRKWREQLDKWKTEKEHQRREQERKVAEEEKVKETEMKKRSQAKEERQNKEREERLKKLAQWKSSKEKSEVKTKSKSSTEVKTEKNERKVKPQPYSRQERQIIAMQLSKYRQQREEVKRLETEKKQAELSQKSRMFNACAREEFKKKDEAYIDSMKEQKAKQLRLKDEQYRKLEMIKSAVQINVSRDKDRLLKLTQSRIAYTASPREGDVPSNVSLDNIVRLATPAWRQGL